jgi:cytochrome c biogenesis protein CcdA
MGGTCMIASESQSKPKTYKTTGYAIAFSLGASLLFLLFGIVIVLPGALRAGPPLWFAWVWILGVVVFLVEILRAVIEIRIRPDDAIELRNVMRRYTVLSAQSIRAIRAHPLSHYTMTIAHAKGKARVLLPMQDLYEFLAWLKQRNPDVQIMWL